MKPFRDIDLSRSLAACKEKMKAKIESFTNDEIMANDIELLVDNVYEEFYIPPVVIHDEDLVRRELKQSKVRKHIWVKHSGTKERRTSVLNGKTEQHL